MGAGAFQRRKRGIFRKFEEGKDFRGDVLAYVAQGSPQADDEIAEKGRLRTETSPEYS